MSRATKVVGHNAHGKALYETTCPICKKARLVTASSVGRRCLACWRSKLTTHGLSKHWLYQTWNSARHRCTNPKRDHFQRYGGRGIRMCTEWADSFETFLCWALANGAARELELDRIDTDGDYEPSNCRFVSHLRNSRNRELQLTPEMVRSMRDRNSQGARCCDIAREFGVNYWTVSTALHNRTWRDCDAPRQ